MNTEAVLQIKEAFRQLCRMYSAAAERICAAWYDGLEIAYLETHRRLPGSTRTARLRKKRRAKVLDWAGRYYGPQEPR